MKGQNRSINIHSLIGSIFRYQTDQNSFQNETESNIKVSSASPSGRLLGTNESAEYKFQSPDTERGESHHGPDTRRQQGDGSRGT